MSTDSALHIQQHSKCAFPIWMQNGSDSDNVAL